MLKLAKGHLPVLLAVPTVALCVAVHPVVAGEISFLEDEASGDFNVVGELRFVSLADLDARVVVNYQEASGDHYAVALAGGRAKFYRVVGGTTSHIGTIGALTPPTEGAETVAFTVQRRDWRMALVWDGRVIARAYDSSLHDGKAGTLVVGAATFEEMMVQPVGDIFVADDFVREAGGQSAWEVITGKWQQRTLREDDQAERQEADKSANAFSYLGQRADDQPAISVTGYWFWDIYSMQTAIKPADDEAVGLVIYFQDADNYLAIRWLGRHHPAGGRLQVVAVQNGQSEVVAEAAGGFRAQQWYCLRCAVSAGVIHVWVDDELRLATETDAFGQGQVGLYCESKQGAFFDDVVCGPWELFTDNFSEAAPDKWQTLQGGWQQSDGSLRPSTNDRALAVTGRCAWEHYEYSITVQPAKSGACGLVVGYQDPHNYCVLRWAEKGTPYAGKAQVVRVKAGEEQVLAEAPIAIPSKSWYRAEATLTDGLIALAVAGRSQVQAFSPDLTGGAVGLFAAGAAGTQFDNALLQIIPPKQTSRITQEFADTSRHPEMAEWASTQAPWVKPEVGSTWWTKGDYFGEHALVLTIPNVGAKSGDIKLLVGAGGPDDKDACNLTVGLSSGSKEVALALRAGDQLLAEAKTQVEGAEAKLSLERRGHWLVVLVNEDFVLQADMASLPKPAQ